MNRIGEKEGVSGGWGLERGGFKQTDRSRDDLENENEIVYKNL